MIDGKQNPPHIYAADAGSAAADLPGPVSSPAPPSAGAEFTVDFGDGDQRNLTLAQVVSAYNKGEVTAEHYVWAEGFDDWRALGEVEQIVDALHASARNPVTATPAAAVPRAAALGGRGADLFGGIDQAGSEEDVTTSAGSPDPMPSAPTATGARNESSVLFSLSALTSAAATAKPSGGGLDGLATSSSSSSKEDSGLIDLKALTAAAAASERREAPAPIGLGLTPSPLGGMGGVGAAPLGLGSPLGGPTTAAAMAFDPGPMPQQKNRTGLYIAAGIVIAAVAVALIVVSSKEEPAPIPSATAIAAPAPTPAPAPAPTPTPTSESTAQPPATGAAEEDAGAPDEKKAPVATRSNWRPKKPATTSTQTSTKPAEASGSGGAKPPPKKKPSSGGCGCAPGDLQCAMRCAAGG
ncbi:MAG TPA: DUF4339 domain-containing protein [Polyangiaceae bacterium]